MVETRTIRVMLVDDHLVVRQGFTIFLDAFDDLELVGEAQNGLEAVEQCPIVRPDVILMDVVMPQMNGIEATRRIRAACPDVQVIALTSFTDDETMVRDALKAGAISYLFKDVSVDELAQAIRHAQEGQITLSPDATRMLVRASVEPPRTDYSLSKRECEVLALMAEGLNNRQIGEQLIISPATAKFHVSKILSKLSVSSRTEAVAVAIQNKLLD